MLFEKYYFKNNIMCQLESVVSIKNHLLKYNLKLESMAIEDY